MLQLLVLLLLLLLPPARAPEPAAQDVSLGVVSAGVLGLLGSAAGLGEASWDPWARRRLRADSNVQGVTRNGIWGHGFLDPSGGLGPRLEDLERGLGGEVGTRTLESI